MPVLQRSVLQRPLLRTTACTGGPVERSPTKHIWVLRFVKHGKYLRKELTDAQLTSFSRLPVPPFLFWSKTWTGARCMRAATGPLISSGTTRARTITLGGNKGTNQIVNQLCKESFQARNVRFTDLWSVYLFSAGGVDVEAAAVTTRRRRNVCALHTGITRSVEHRLHKDLFLGHRILISHKQR